MCLGIPGLVVERQESGDELASAVVEFAGVRRRVCIACVPESQPGDYVIVHAGIAISRIDPVEAGRVFAFLEESGDRDGWDEGGEPAGAGEDRP
jgi:hydrogenase expression/formation protein HypC